MVRQLLLISALLLGFSQARAEGVFMVVKGDIKVEKNGKAVPAKVGMKVVQADTIIAGKDARAKIVMKDKNVLNISPDSKIVIEKYVSNEKTDDKNVTLNVLYGKVRSTVNQKYDGEKNKFHVKTPSAVAGVRGTDFISGYQPDIQKAEFVTFEGQVEVGTLDAGGNITNSVFVNPGEMTSTVAGLPPKPPAPLPQSELAKMEGDTKADLKSDRQPAGDSNKQDKQEKGGAKSEGDRKGTDNRANPNEKGEKRGTGNAQGNGQDKGQGQKVGFGGSSAPMPPPDQAGMMPPPDGMRDPASVPPPDCMFCGAEGPIGGGDYADIGDAGPGGEFIPYEPPEYYNPDPVVSDDIIQNNGRTSLTINITY